MRVYGYHCLVCGKRGQQAEAVLIEGKEWQVECPTCGNVETIRSGILTDIQDSQGVA